MATKDQDAPLAPALPPIEKKLGAILPAFLLDREPDPWEEGEDRGNVVPVDLPSPVEVQRFAASKSISGLSPEHRIVARSMAVEAALLSYHHALQVHYSQGSHRWDGITHHLKAWRGQFPTLVDCSSSVEWWVWNGLDHFGVRDTMSGLGWRGGWTGTLFDHGARVRTAAQLIRADYVLYGDPFGGTGHTALVVGRRKVDNKPMVISHGSEDGPKYLPYDYRRVAALRRGI